jgi:hypothetical protein
VGKDVGGWREDGVGYRTEKILRYGKTKKHRKISRDANSIPESKILQFDRETIAKFS